MAPSQRDLMRELFNLHSGDRGAVLDAYIVADERGEVRRTRNANGTSSREYAIRLWASGMHMGWLPKEGGCRTLTAISKKITRDAVPLFEVPLAAMGIEWRNDPSRPQPTNESLTYWSNLVDEWVLNSDMPLLIRKGRTSGESSGKLASGRTFVRCDNSPAHWAYMGCFADERPSLEDVVQQIAEGFLPIAMARTRGAEKSLIEAGTHVPCGGFLSRSKYGQVNKFSDRCAYKLCHLRAVGLGSRGEVESFEEKSLRSHMKLLLDPTNMIVVPQRYSGVGECQAFLDAFADNLDS